MLAITPGTLIYTASVAHAYQYIFMVGGVYVLLAVFTLFIYFSRLYTNRTVLAGVGKAYIPIEDGEVGRGVRKLIVDQLQRSAIVAWEARPRDLLGEITTAESQGLIPTETATLGHDDYTVGRLITVDPARPPWGHVQHPGWSSPSHADAKKTADVQFANVVMELPNLIEARAVSLAPADPTMPYDASQPAMADPTIVEVLQRPATMGLRDYITQLTYLSLFHPPTLAQTFLMQYERARFSGRPISESDFASLMATFSTLLNGMEVLDDAIFEQIRTQTLADNGSILSAVRSDHSSTDSGLHSPVTARTRRTVTPYLQQSSPSASSMSQTSVVMRSDAFHSTESLGSVIHHPREGIVENSHALGISTSLESVASESGSVIVRHGDG